MPRFIHVHLPVHDDLSEGLTLAIFNGGRWAEVQCLNWGAVNGKRNEFSVPFHICMCARMLGSANSTPPNFANSPRQLAGAATVHRRAAPARTSKMRQAWLAILAGTAASARTTSSADDCIATEDPVPPLLRGPAPRASKGLRIAIATLISANDQDPCKGTGAEDI